jgi:Mg-chelatase subunit ChlI
VAEGTNFPLLPYSYIVGQDQLKWLLEVDYVMRSSVGGVLISGERGTAKSTIVRSFANMISGQLPVTLPINTTDGRVVGDWDVKSLASGAPEKKPGLLQKANGKMLYIDEVNLLDDHIINLILDVASTNVLVVEREGMDEEIRVAFSLVGTMNPEEGALRPQLLDRFGLFMDMKAEKNPAVRAEILRRVLRFDVERDLDYSSWLEEGRRQRAQTSGRPGQRGRRAHRAGRRRDRSVHGYSGQVRCRGPSCGNRDGPGRVRGGSTRREVLPRTTGRLPRHPARGHAPSAQCCLYRQVRVDSSRRGIT